MGDRKESESVIGMGQNMQKQSKAVKRALDERLRVKLSHQTVEYKYLRQSLDGWIRQSGKSTEIRDIESKLAVMDPVHRENEGLVALGKKALKEIGDASSSVSSAQGMEMVDLVTQNKGFSLMSTVMNSSAGSDMAQAKRAIEAFANAIKQRQEKVEGLRHDMTLEWLDLGFDILDIMPAFDVGSMLSLWSLSSSSLALDAAESDVKKMLVPLEKAAAVSQAEVRRLRDLLAAAKLAVLKASVCSLGAYGLEIPSEDVLITVAENHQSELGATAGVDA